jgi:uracil-DNA glycosylase family 4
VFELEQVYSRIRSCKDCGLCDTRTQAVPGEGPADATVMFVGEGPGFHEDQQARPFVGPAGKLLDELLGLGGLTRTEVYITNVVKCRPPNNRDPLPAEVEACKKYLEQQLALINPKLVVTLGRYSLAWFFPRDSISKVHGHLRRQNGTYYLHMYHPAAALHAGNLRKTIEDDFRKIPTALDKIRQAEQPVAVAEAATEQMRLF